MWVFHIPTNLIKIKKLFKIIIVVEHEYLLINIFLCYRMKIHLRKIIFLVVIANGYNVICEESAQYLQNAVRDLRNLNLRQTIRRSDSLFNTNENDENLAQSSTIKIHQRNEKNIVPPPLSLTKGELAALYEAAIAKGETIKLDTGDNSYVNAAIHELDGAETQDINSKKHNYNTETSSSISGNEGDSSGYYYYYYPIKSFLDEMISQSHQVMLINYKYLHAIMYSQHKLFFFI